MERNPDSINAGDMFFTNRAFSGPSKNHLRYKLEVEGYFIAVCLGYVQPLNSGPKNAGDFVRLLGGVGLIGMDTIHEVFGDEGAKKITDYILEKYPAGPVTEEKEPSRLILLGDRNAN